jgi:membrane protein implicated in regulation of membrane protease activity
MAWDAGGGLWFVIDVIAVAILAVALIYGTMQWRRRRRDRATEQHRERATQDLYHREQR